MYRGGLRVRGRFGVLRQLQRRGSHGSGWVTQTGPPKRLVWMG
jgi:hypothetical protein